MAGEIAIRAPRPAWIISHLAAVAYLGLAGVAAVGWRGGGGLSLQSYFGPQFPRLLCYPIGIWAVTLAYAAWAGKRGTRRPRAWLSHTLLLGLVVHVSFLVAAFLRNGSAVRLPSPMFTLYVQLVSLGFLELVLLWAISRVASWHAEAAATLWLPLVYLPLGYSVLLPWKLTVLLAAFATGLWCAWRGAWLRGARARIGNALIAAWSNPRMFMAGVYGLALLFRVLAAHRLAGMGFETVLLNSDDAQQYDRNARILLAGQTIGTSWSVGYSGMLALLYRLSHEHLLSILLIHACFSSLVPVGVYLIGKAAWSDATGRLASILSAMSQLLVFNSVNLTREMPGILGVVWMVVLLYRLLRAPAGGRLWELLGVGVLVGVLIPIDPIFLLVVTMLAIGALGYRRWPMGRRVRAVGVVLATLLIVAMAVHERLLGRAVVVSRERSSAIHLSKDFNPYAQALYERRINLVAYPTELLTAIARQPAENLTLIAKKLWLDARDFFFQGNAGAFDPLVLMMNSFLAANVLFYAYGFGLLGFVTGLRVDGRRLEWVERFLVYLIVGAYSACYIVVFCGMTRYRATIQPLLLLFVSAGLVRSLGPAIQAARIHART